MMVAYETDPVEWAKEQAKLLAERRFDELDLEHLVEEVEDLGRGFGRELKSRLIVLIMHMLKWDYQPMQRSRSWYATIQHQRTAITDLLEETPSLRRVLDTIAEQMYPKGRLQAVRETMKEEMDFPEATPYTTADLMNAEVSWPPER